MTRPVVLVLHGTPAFTPTRVDKLLARLRAIDPAVTGVAATWTHIVDASGELDADARAILDRLLDYGPRIAPSSPPGPASQRVWVVPRLGTVSPWSSKATDIARICGLAAVRRIERGIRYTIHGDLAPASPPALLAALHDRMTESVIRDEGELSSLFAHHPPRPMDPVRLGADPHAALSRASTELGLALAPDEIDYLVARYGELGRDPTDVELMMFAQANSEHCRHKIFNAEWWIGGEKQPRSLFQMIKRSTEASPGGVLSAYKDNAAVIEGSTATRLFPDPDRVYRHHREAVHILAKVETHNHPTAISPFPGAATGSGGEIRDEGATGRGGKPKAGLTGFTVSNLRLPGAIEPWEATTPEARPDHIASPLDIMIDGPIGGAAFNNEFGRPGILGWFRTFELDVGGEIRGYHKPIMLAGGIGNVRPQHVTKAGFPDGTALVVLGGPAFLIGLGGGAASSVGQGDQRADLDFASVQRDNAEIQRRCQEVIDRCWALGDDNPILSIHDVGAGGLSNALPELVHDAGRGARIDLRAIPSGEPGMSPRELWCNEAQERYVLAIDPARLDAFAATCARERAPWAVVGRATDDERLVIDDAVLGAAPVDVPLDVIFGKPPRMVRRAERTGSLGRPLDLGGATVGAALDRVLGMPAVADKTFLVTIGDRTVGGMIARDAMVGRFQVPVADCAVTVAGYETNAGEAFAIGERPALALLSAPASARMAVGEALTNLAAAPIGALGRVKLSCNWMAAAGHPGDDARLYDAVRAVGDELAPALGIAIPVGKDSMSMRTAWVDRDGARRSVVSPVTLVATAFAPVGDVRRAVTPDAPPGCELVLVDLGNGKHRLGGSCLAQAYGQIGEVAPDLDDPALMRAFWAAIQELIGSGLVAAYHDRSDGGLAATLLEMAFAGGVGLAIDVAPLGDDPMSALFAEELGAVIAVALPHRNEVQAVLARHYLGGSSHAIGRTTAGDRVVIRRGHDPLVDATRAALRARWSNVSHRIKTLRDDAASAAEEHAAAIDPATPGLAAVVPFDIDDDITAPLVGGARPRVAIVRDQGVNGQVEMAAAFTRAGFDAVDVHVTDLIEGRDDLSSYRGVVTCGGFAFGDVLGAGLGTAKSIAFDRRARAALETFFHRPDTFTLGACNGCQMIAGLRDLIPGAEAWPRFVKNRSEQFEGRLSLVEIAPGPSIVFAGMAGARLPIAVAHGEGRAELDDDEHLARLERDGLVAARFVDGAGRVATTYPANPNGSPGGITALTTPDGRATILMPHPERVFRTVQLSWHPAEWGEDSPWMRLFRNARVWVG
jgi:phosphoribosylformylglycinamidine synthase